MDSITPSASAEFIAYYRNSHLVGVHINRFKTSLRLHLKFWFAFRSGVTISTRRERKNDQR
jgi:hypothetical protein